MNQINTRLVADLGLGNLRPDKQLVKSVSGHSAEYGPPEGYLSLREKIALWEQVSVDEIVLTTGASMGLVATLATLERPASILCPRPYYPAYPKVAKTLGLDVIYYDLEKNLGWLPNPQKLRELIREDTRALLWNFPNNPTGSLPTPTLLKEITAIVRSTNLSVISDEVYSDFIYDSHLFPNMRMVFGAESLVRLRSFSKLFGIPGERLGYVIAEPNRLQDICRKHWSLAMSPPATAQGIALMSLRSDPKQELLKLQQFLTKNRDLAVDILKKCDRIQFDIPPAGFFFWIQVPDCSVDSMTLARICRLKAETIVMPGAAFGISSSVYLRASFAVPRVELKQGFEALVNFLRQSMVDPQLSI
jgi:aspartate/methionine/tyrosine aminotransferase